LLLWLMAGGFCTYTCSLFIPLPIPILYLYLYLYILMLYSYSFYNIILYTALFIVVVVVSPCSVPVPVRAALQAASCKPQTGCCLLWGGVGSVGVGGCNV